MQSPEMISCIRAGDFKPEMTFEQVTAKAISLERTPELEANPEFLQLVIYAVIMDPSRPGHFLHYQRTKDPATPGEPRLLGKFSIGFGGHFLVGEGWEAALTRELKEEVGLTLEPGHDAVSRLGYIRETDTPVNQVHLGFLVAVFTDKPTASTDPAIRMLDPIDRLSVSLRKELFEAWSVIASKRV